MSSRQQLEWRAHAAASPLLHVCYSPSQPRHDATYVQQLLTSLMRSCRWGLAGVQQWAAAWWWQGSLEAGHHPARWASTPSAGASSVGGPCATCSSCCAPGDALASACLMLLEQCLQWLALAVCQTSSEGCAHALAAMQDCVCITRADRFTACRQAVQAFCSGMQCGLGTSGAVAVGPLGRQADAGLQVGPAGAAMLYSYSVSRGVFAGELNCC